MPLRFRILPTDAGPASPDGDRDGPLVARDVELADGGDELRLGRRADVELPLPFAVLSGVHARLRRVDSGWSVEDAGSTNGTWLDGVRLAPGERRPLTRGAELRLASVRVRFEGTTSAVPTAEGTATIARRLVSDLFADDAAGAPTLRVARGAPAHALTLAVVGRAYVVGRAETCGLCLPVDEVSREHAVVTRGAEGVTVRDLESKNGVLVNGARVAGEGALADGDLVQIGPVTLTFEDPVSRYLRELASETAAPPPAPDPAPLAPPASAPAAEPPAPVRSTQLITGIAIAALLLLVVAAVAILF